MYSTKMVVTELKLSLSFEMRFSARCSPVHSELPIRVCSWMTHSIVERTSSRYCTIIGCKARIMSCIPDWQYGVVYDRWVLRSMSGHPYYDYEDIVQYTHQDWKGHIVPKLLSHPEDAEERQRFTSYLPTQVFSCWNGMAAINARAFYPPKSLRFRGVRIIPLVLIEPVSYSPLTGFWWGLQMTKIQIVPRAS